ncbi:MAG: AarF/ABC1/UbiB kinase family protein [Anaerolineae bacterium]|nr:AarF/ABC1/UbiB kinase family protein [Anaerolineae bacterium]
MLFPDPEPPAHTRPDPDTYPIQWRRYWRTLRFAAWLFVRVLGWELVLRRLIGERRIGRGRAARMQRWAGEFRALAVAMGGVMIKLGQFISSRVDILPPDVIRVLATLQDEVPTVPSDLIRKTLAGELGPPETVFARFDPVPVAAASLGQAHRAHLLDGTRVVVKVQRPGIRVLVHTDLAALAVVGRWAMRIPFIRRRANVPALLDEFSAVLWDELDYTLEAAHAEAFRDLFAQDKGIYIPQVYRAHTTPRVLTLEDVSAIKITDYERITAAGIDRCDVARRLINTYLWMIFTKRFFHADPHPGNLFVYPLPDDASPGSGQHASGQPLLGRPFYLVFVDFGMAGRVTEEIVAGLSETLIALATRDARRLVESYQQLGVLLPGADLDRIEQAARAAFDRVWGMNLSEISGMQFTEMADLSREFSDLLFTLPFQVPQDFIVLARCVGILAGICTGLNPDFDPWKEVYPFVERLLAGNGETIPPIPGTPGASPANLWRALASRQTFMLLLDMGRRVASLPALADDVLRRADRGDLSVQAALTPELERRLDRMEGVIRRLASAVLFGGLAISGAILYAAGEHTLSAVGLALAGVLFLRGVFGGR